MDDLLRALAKLFPELWRSTWIALAAGLLLRLLLMPFSAHSDLMYAYWDAHQITYHLQFTTQLQTLLQYLHAGYLWLISFLLPPAEALWLHQAQDPFLNPFLSTRVVSTQGWFDFISQPQIFRTLFLLKTPYLLFDAACAYGLYRLGSSKQKSEWLVRFWWLNPIIIFAVYVFGRHEVIGLFFVILSLYLLRREKHGLAFLSLGLAIAIRYYALLLLPIFVLSLDSTWKRHVWHSLFGLAPWFVVNLLTWALAGSTEAQSLISIPHDHYLLAMRLPIATWDNLYIFPFLYLLLLLHRLYNRQYGFRSLQQYSLIALLILFATSYTGQSPQYWTWFVPFLALEAADNRQLLPLHVAQIACLIIYAFLGGRSTGGYLFAPFAPDFFWSLPSAVELIRRAASPEVVIGLAHTAFAASTVWMIYLCFKGMSTCFSGQSPST